MFGLTPLKFKLPAFLAPALLLLGSAGAAAQGNSQNANGQPFEALQQQINALQSQIDTLNAGIDQGPIEIDVDCNAGDTIGGAIASVGDAPNPLIITVSGTCPGVVLFRSDVTLRGQSPSDGISGGYAVLASRGANHITVESMTLTGSAAGLACFNGASVAASNVSIINSNTGVQAFNGGSCFVSDSVIDGSNSGVSVSTSSSAWLRGVDVTNSVTGANVFTNGALYLTASPSNGSFSTISGSSVMGMQIFANGSVWLNRAIIENNNLGISVLAGSSLFTGGGDIALIQNNAGTGVRIQGLGNTIISDGVSITGNGGWGLQCLGTSWASLNGSPDISGNSDGDIFPDCGVGP